MELDEAIKKQKDVYNKELKRLFGNRIKPNFLIEIKERVFREYINFFQNYHISFDMSSLVSGIADNAPEYDVCRMIVGCHKANTIFLSDSERSSLQQSEDYKKKLIKQVFEEIDLRRYAGVFFRKLQLIPGDEFLYFPVLYKLFAISSNSANILSSPNLLSNTVKKEYYINLFNKGLASLTLIENNFMDSAYPLVRGIIEIYVKSLFVTDESQSKEHKKFLFWELLKTANEEYPEEFEKSFEQRFAKSQKSKVDYLHFGWVDRIDSYHENIKGVNPYSIYGLFAFLKANSDDARFEDLNLLQTIYSRCHAFTHGSIGNSGYPLLHYFELAIGLYIPLVSTYESLCKATNIDSKINNVDIINSIKADFNLLRNQYENKSTESFENYYKR